MASVQWIDEKTAAEKVNRKPRTLRKLVLSGKWNINYTAPNGRTYQYDEKSIDQLLRSFSNVTV